VEECIYARTDLKRTQQQQGCRISENESSLHFQSEGGCVSEGKYTMREIAKDYYYARLGKKKMTES